jgi:hypothetical protein
VKARSVANPGFPKREGAYVKVKYICHFVGQIQSYTNVILKAFDEKGGNPNP